MPNKWIIRFRENYMSFKLRMKGFSKSPILIAKELDKSQYWSRKMLEAYQMDKLKIITSEAKENVKYYQNEKYDDKEFYATTDEFFKKTPILEKDDIKEFHKDLLNKKNIRSFTHRTSGTTGTPMAFEISEAAENYRLASMMRFYQWWGTNMFDKNVLLWKKRSNGNTLVTIFKRIELRLLGRLELDVFNINDKTIFDYFNKIEAFKPVFIRGYKSGVFELARLMEKYNLQFTNSKLKMIVVTSETLFVHEKLFIEKILKCKVANEYGAAEGGLYAVECPNGSLHINEESVYICSDSNHNAYVTELFNHSMPLINYKNEDRIEISENKCSCGKNLRVIDVVKGRISDFIVCPDGTRIHSHILGTMMSYIQKKYGECIKQYRTIQHGNILNFEIIPGKDYELHIEDNIRHYVSSKISYELKVEIQFVEQIKREKSGKLRNFIRQT